ncbi:hypothetical protein T484DRAFT_1623107 [Baffinella frigidus]|nr:hypothetical protein T484DRAFT_1623107 [Cryptophyta sp. CCMP2293]
MKANAKELGKEEPTGSWVYKTGAWLYEKGDYKWVSTLAELRGGAPSAPSAGVAELRGGGAGVTVTTTQPGDGATFPKKGDTLQMHYKGTLQKDGSKFDASYDRGTPFVFTIGVGQVIKGWDEGVMKMSLGEKATLNVSPDYGYGARVTNHSILSSNFDSG